MLRLRTRLHWLFRTLICPVCLFGIFGSGLLFAQGPASVTAEVMPPLAVRFAAADVSEVPDFQRHIGPLLGHLGCNGRACHGSFQGRGGFMLSLFGYDFAADHKALTDPEAGRVDLAGIDESLILAKPLDAAIHEGGKRMDAGSWQHRVLKRWIEAGAEYDGTVQRLERVSVEPKEVLFNDDGQMIRLKVTATWADGISEDVTDLCRFTTNDDSIATVSQDGTISSGSVGDTHVVIAYDSAVIPVTVIRPNVVSPEGIPRPSESTHPIDVLIAEKHEKLGIIPSQLCGDSDFIRRVSLDLAGTLPSSERVERFLADQSPNKRESLVDELLAAPGYAAWWATRMSDWTGNNENQLNNYLPVRGLASKFWFAWLKKRFAENLPYDRIVEGIVTAQSRLPEESYLQYCETMSEACRAEDYQAFASRPGMPIYWARNNFRTNEERAIGFAYSFLGVKIECAQCHKHPFDRWSKDDFDRFAILFAPVRANPNSVSPSSQKDMRDLTEQITGGQKLNGGDLRRKLADAVREGKVVPFPELSVVSLQSPRKLPGQEKNRPNQKKKSAPVRSGRILGEDGSVEVLGDPREALMAWLRSPENPYFAKAIVNRVWANYFGVGIVDPVDDLNLGNPPSNERLMEYLTDGFVNSGFNLHWLHKQIIGSHAYQRGSDANQTNIHDKRNFSRHLPRRLPAEVLRDSVRLATLGPEAESRARAELTGLAINSDANAGQPGRGVRGDFALQVFGQSTRESNCDCDRSDQSNLLQSLYLRNDIDIHKALSSKGGWLDTVTSNWGGAGSEDVGRSTAVLAARGRKQMLQRIEQFLRMPENRKSQIRPRLVEELRQINSRRVKDDLEPLRFADLIGEARQNLRGSKFEDETIDPDSLDREAGIAAQASVVSTGAAKPDVGDSEINGVIRGAYLRALSRFPEEEELSIARDYIKQSPNSAAGMRAVMWALLNTKEFVLTH